MNRRKPRKKRKKGSSNGSTDSESYDNLSKQSKVDDSEIDLNISVSEILSQTSNVLYNSYDNSVFAEPQIPPTHSQIPRKHSDNSNMSDRGSPSNQSDSKIIFSDKLDTLINTVKGLKSSQN